MRCLIHRKCLGVGGAFQSDLRGVTIRVGEALPGHDNIAVARVMSFGNDEAIAWNDFGRVVAAGHGKQTDDDAKLCNIHAHSSHPTAAIARKAECSGGVGAPTGSYSI